MVAAIYARKSTDQHLPDAEKSVTRQVEHATAYAAQQREAIEAQHRQRRRALAKYQAALDAAAAAWAEVVEAGLVTGLGPGKASPAAAAEFRAWAAGNVP